MFDVDNLAWSYTADPGGLYTYRYELDNSQFVLSRFGDTVGSPEDATGTQPEGWVFLGAGWGHSGAGKVSSNAKFSITTTRKPGLIPIFFQSKEAYDVYFPAKRMSSAGNTRPCLGDFVWNQMLVRNSYQTASQKRQQKSSRLAARRDEW
jgi:hypothetical protein